MGVDPFQGLETPVLVGCRRGRQCGRGVCIIPGEVERGTALSARCFRQKGWGKIRVDS